MATQTLTQMWNLNKKKLPPASDEQRTIVHAVRGGNCVQITAYAGTGKSTTALIIVCDDDKTNTILTYNKSLADETNATIRGLGIPNVKCYTYHARVGIAAGLRGEVDNNTKFLQVVRQWDNGGEVLHPICTDRLMLDEVQDMRPSFHRAVLHMVRKSQPQMCIFGDSHQTLYDYGADDAAHTGFLLSPYEYFSTVTPGQNWVPCTLSVSYRLTPRIACFVNHLWGTQILPGNKGTDLPVEYWCLNIFDSKLISRLKHVFESYPAADVSILTPFNVYSHDGKEMPLNKIINTFLYQTCQNGKRRYNFSVKKKDGTASSHENKIRVWTYHASKGCTIKVTVVFGFSAYRGRQPKKNALGVAISRSNHRLIVIHERDRYGHPQPYCEPFNKDVLTDFVRGGIVVAPDGIPNPGPCLPEPPREEVLPVTGLTHLSAATIERLLTFGTVVNWVGTQEDISVQSTHKFLTGLYQTEEDVSAVYGIAIPFALEYERTGTILFVESILSPVLVDKDRTYMANEVVNLVEQVSSLTHEDASRIREQFPDDKKVRGKTVIERLRVLRRTCSGLRNVCVSDRHRFDSIFASHHLRRVNDVYANAAKTARDFMYLANACTAVEGSHELFVQVGDDYTWVDAHAFSEGLRILQRDVPSGDFECSIHASVDPPVRGGRVIVAGFAGCVDLRVSDTLVYELKFVRELGSEHLLQSTLYAAILAVNIKAAARCVLLNARTGERVETEVTPANARLLLHDSAACRAA